jgi:hypothetical protein
MIVSEKRLAANRRNSYFKQCGGRAPEIYRCQTICKRTGERCKWWRCRFSSYCYRHGGRRSRGKGRNNYNPTPIYNGRLSCLQGRKMPPLYRKYLRKTLSQAVSELCNMPPDEQLQVFEELALMRDAAGQAVWLYGIAREIADAKPDDIEARRNALEAAAIMREALMEVVKVVDRAAAINAQAKDKVSVLTLQHFVDQIVLHAWQCFGDDDPRVKDFVVAIRDGVKIPDTGTSGTTMLPSDDVAAMDASVPRSEP